MHLTDLEIQKLQGKAHEGWLPSPDLFVKVMADLQEANSRMATGIEVYALAACPETRRIWALDPEGAWSLGPVVGSSEPDTFAKMALAARGALDLERGTLHQTSCRTEIFEETGRSRQIDTFVAAVPLDGPILASWPYAEPITEALLAKLGPAEPHGPMEVPWVDDGDVLQHGLGVYAELMGSSVRADAESAARLEQLHWRQPMAEVEEQMFKHFRRVRQAA